MPDAEHNFETTFEASTTMEPTTQYPTTIDYEPANMMMNDFIQVEPEYEYEEEEEEYEYQEEETEYQEETEYDTKPEYETEQEVINYDEETLPDVDNGARRGNIENSDQTQTGHQLEAMQMDVPINQQQQQQQQIHQRSSQYGQQPQQQQNNNNDTHVYEIKADFQVNIK